MIIPIPYYDLICFEMYGKKLYNGNYLKLIKGYAKPTQRNPKQDIEEVTGLKKIPMVASQSVKISAKNVRRINGKFVIVD